MLAYEFRRLSVGPARLLVVRTGAIIAVFCYSGVGIWPIVEIEKNLCGANKSRAAGIDTWLGFGYWGSLGQMGVEAVGS